MSEISPQGYSNLQLRIASSILMIAVSAAVLWLGGWVMIVAMVLLAMQMNREWEAMNPQSSWLWRISGVIYSALPCISLVILRQMEFMQSESASLNATLFPIAMVIATDVGAYFAGRIIGGPKLASKISPKKTWAGLLGGMLASAAVATLLYTAMPWPESPVIAISLGIGIALLGQMGDLLESALKRRFNIKDSGNLIPGHGGVLDRMDGYVFALPCYVLLLLSFAEYL